MGERLEDRIRARAQEIWEEEGRPSGKAEEHWRRASEELKEDAIDPRTHPSSGEPGTSSLESGGTTLSADLEPRSASRGSVAQTGAAQARLGR
ncbi:DUF2934 domain-containing protein (plasmid) [Pelagibacterium sp. H642]|nr:DUF2934 domain-containing protein [Pelagibacterium sp. H642]